MKENGFVIIFLWNIYEWKKLFKKVVFLLYKDICVKVWIVKEIVIDK